MKLGDIDVLHYGVSVSFYNYIDENTKDAHIIDTVIQRIPRVGDSIVLETSYGKWAGKVKEIIWEYDLRPKFDDDEKNDQWSDENPDDVFVGIVIEE